VHTDGMTTATIRRWTIEFGMSPSGRATAYAVNARAAETGARVQWTDKDGVRWETQRLVPSYAREFAGELRFNGRTDVVVVDS
jgi:hypothetical protein